MVAAFAECAANPRSSDRRMDDNVMKRSLRFQGGLGVLAFHLLHLFTPYLDVVSKINDKPVHAVNITPGGIIRTHTR
jgi:hypothetical protein